MKRFVFLLCVLLLVVSPTLIGCQKAEETGAAEAAEEAMDTAVEAGEEAMDAAAEAGEEAMDAAGEAAEEAIDEAADAAKDAVGSGD